MRESGRRLERIARFVCQKITQTELCRVLIHPVVNCLSLTPVSTEGASRQSSELSCFTDSLRSCPLHPHAAEFRVGAANLAGFGFQDKTFDAVTYRPWTAYLVWSVRLQEKRLLSRRLARIARKPFLSGVLPSLPRRAENVIPQWRADAVPDVIIFVMMAKMILLHPE